MKTQTDPAQDQIIHNNFPKDIAFKRVQKEIDFLKSLNKSFYKVSILNSPIGLKILVETQKAALQNFCDLSQINHIQMVLFEILLEPKFPFVFPKIFCRTSFCKPSIADGRDILIDIIKKTWTPSILLHEIITLFPIFMKETLSKNKDVNHLQRIGTYHLGCLYNLEDFLLMDSVDVFPVNELMPNNKTIPRYLVLSQSNLLNFEIIDKKNNQMKLISWANLQSLLNIKRKKDEQFTLILTWKDAHKSEGLTQIIALEQATKFCELIIRNMKSFGVKISKNIIKQPDLTLDDVTVKAYDQIDIMDLLENITILESRLPEEFTIDIVNTLMMLYQKAVEYYSALNDPAYDDYLEKLHLLLSREDVQILLRSKTEVKSGQTEKTKKDSKKTVESEEEEEEKKQGGGGGAKIEEYFTKTNLNIGGDKAKEQKREEKKISKIEPIQEKETINNSPMDKSDTCNNDNAKEDNASNDNNENANDDNSSNAKKEVNEDDLLGIAKNEENNENELKNNHDDNKNDEVDLLGIEGNQDKKEEKTIEINEEKNDSNEEKKENEVEAIQNEEKPKNEDNNEKKEEEKDQKEEAQQSPSEIIEAINKNLEIGSENQGESN